MVSEEEVVAAESFRTVRWVGPTDSNNLLVTAGSLDSACTGKMEVGNRRQISFSCNRNRIADVVAAPFNIVAHFIGCTN